MMTRDLFFFTVMETPNDYVSLSTNAPYFSYVKGTNETSKPIPIDRSQAKMSACAWLQLMMISSMKENDIK